MRAKEYLEINKERILYFDIVKSAIDALGPLRNKKRETEEYFNRYLFADARILANEKEFVLNEGEVDDKLAQDVRINIMNAVCKDESFIYAYNTIVMQKNEYFSLTPLNFCQRKDFNSNTVSEIERVCSLYKEDYPKEHICDFLLDDKNREYAQSKNCLENGGLDWWKDIFNKAYEQFDIIRVQLRNGFNELNFIESICEGDEKKDREVIDLLSYMFSYYSYDLDEIQMKRYRILSESLKSIYYKKHQVINLVAENSYEQEITSLKRENEQLRSKLDKDPNVMTCSQQVMAFIYMLNYFGINTENTKKSILTRFINRIIGRSEDNIRKRLDINYDDVNVKQNLRTVAETFQELLPGTSDQILRDIEG